MARIRGNFSLCVSVFLLLLSATVAYQFSVADGEASPQAGEIIEIEINGSINPSTVDYIKTALLEARAQNARALLILMDTPGGLLNSTKDIVKELLNSEIPVIVYVYPRGATATSAGVFITLSAHVAAMSPGTSIGAAHPVMLGRGQKGPGKQEEKNDKSSDVMNEKIENFASSFIESIAKERGRNAKWAVDSVRKSVSVTADEALKKKVIDIISPDIPSLLSEIDGKEVKLSGKSARLETAGAKTQRLEMSLRQKVVNILSTPDIAFLLLSLGTLGIFLEFYNPGMIFPGVAGLIALLIGFVSLQILPFNYAGLILLFVAMALLISEVYVTSYGLLSLAALACLVFGGLLLFDTPDSDLRVSKGTIAAVAISIGLLSVFIVYLGVKSFKVPVQGGFEGMVGQKGEVVSWSQKSGKVYIGGEYWEATGEREFSPGEKIKVTESRGDLAVKISAYEDEE
ncbi:MAG: nodulation protein NfeD [Candidatus Dadabacteria bacterium]|nr:nodulation protein NfeD [Candidatus Dadabacteria bacterium]MYC40172.1 nodulation protein NfeD [Candidatus Dadabacteria bacterium]